jgi:hypothetical protein
MRKRLVDLRSHSRVVVLTTFAGLLVAAAVAAACGSGTSEDLSGAPGSGTPDGSTLPGTDDAAAPPDEGINKTGMGAGTGAATGLPCDVQQLLENRCIGCHLGASPPALLTYADLLKPSSDPTKNLAQKSLERMKSTTSPMPPAPAVAPDAQEISVMEKWVTAGTPMGAVCTPPAGDGGVDGGDAGPVTNPYNTPTVCTSMTTWNGGNNGSSRMRPGGACITCHTMRGGPAYSVAGTVYPTAHEPNDCNGVNAGGVTVVVTDANGVVTNLPVNSVGNFYTRNKIAAPFHVKVTNGAKQRVMAGALTAGDCNSCHTLAGVNGAPGRIMAP